MRALRVKRVINNNILCVIDDDNHELIVTGKGLGFQRKPGEFIDHARVEKSYRMEGRDRQRKLRELAAQIPLEHLSLTQELIDHIKEQIPQTLNESLFITLADHISFAIQRKAEGLEFRTRCSITIRRNLTGNRWIAAVLSSICVTLPSAFSTIRRWRTAPRSATRSFGA